MKDLGLGKSKLEEAIIFEAEQLSEAIIASTSDSDGDIEIDGQFNIPVVNVGLSPGGGPATGYIMVDHGLLRTTTLTAGPGAVLEFNANWSRRATGSNDDTVYAAADVDTAALAGEVVVDLQFFPTGPVTCPASPASQTRRSPNAAAKCG